MITLSNDHRKIVTDILLQYLGEIPIYVFGSRATATPKPFSDLDLLIRGEKAIDAALLYQIKDAFADSDLPIRVDLVDWHQIQDNFKEIIEKNCVELKLK